MNNATSADRRRKKGSKLYIKKGLEEEGYAVDWAADGKTGCSMGLDDVYDLIILDVNLPHKDGLTAMISEHVWDHSFDTETNVIDVYVNYLRKKIDADQESKLIHTVRGVGYVLKEE